MARKPIDLPLDEIRRLTEAGWRMGRIAAHLGCSKDQVWGAMKRAGISRHPKHSCPGEQNPSWRGGRTRDGDGYILVYSPEHPHRTKAGYVREHRLVMERELGRYLLPTEVVDHIDGNRSNNAPPNLRVFASNRDHLEVTLAGRVPRWTEDGRERIRAAHTGRPSSPVSDETRRKMSKAQRERPRGAHSEQTIQKLREAAIRRGGRPHTPESREKIRQAALLRAAMTRTSIPPASRTDAPS